MLRRANACKAKPDRLYVVNAEGVVTSAGAPGPRGHHLDAWQEAIEQETANGQPSLGMGDTFEVGDPVLGKAVRPGAVPQQRDVAERWVAVGGLPLR